MVLAPEHPLVNEITTPEQRAAVEEYITQTSRKSDLARTDLAKDKSGVFTGAYAFNPVYEDRADSRAKIQIWIADYVLMGYGTGAIMAVPAHDGRDAEFALKFKLPIIAVVMPPEAMVLPSVVEHTLSIAPKIKVNWPTRLLHWNKSTAPKAYDQGDAIARMNDIMKCMAHRI